MYTHKLSQPNVVAGWTEIEEPIGFDNFKTTLSRGTLHGMSIENSVGTLEFIGNDAVDLIRRTYLSDIDARITYLVEDKGTEVFRGILDFATYQERQYDDYCSISCAMGNIGIETDFTVRKDVEMNVEANTDIDGKKRLPPLRLHKLTIPQRTLVYTNMYGCDDSNNILWQDDSIPPREMTFIASESPDKIALAAAVSIKLPNALVEHGENTEQKCFIARCPFNLKYPDLTNWNDVHAYTPFFKKDDSWKAKSIQYCYLNGRIKAKVNLSLKNFTHPEKAYIKGWAVLHRQAPRFHFSRTELGEKAFGTDVLSAPYLAMFPGDIIRQSKEFMLPNGNEIEYNIDVPFGNKDLPFEQIKNEEGLFLSFVFKVVYPDKDDTSSYVPYAKINSINYDTSSKLLLRAVSSTDVYSSEILAIPVYDLLNRMTHKIADIPVISNWYATKASEFKYVGPNRHAGGGAAKCITNGYRMRQAQVLPSQDNIKASFYKLLKSLTAIDGIGYGFENITKKNAPNNPKQWGGVCVRVERWDYFYQQDIMLELSDVPDVKRQVQPDDIYNELKIGYKKYMEDTEMSVADTFHTQLSFVAEQKTVGNKLELISDLIADPYIIELTRRQVGKNNKGTSRSGWRYDNDLFVIETILRKVPYDLTPAVIGYDHIVAQGVTNAQNILDPKDTLNPSLSPQRNALRNRHLLFTPRKRQQWLFQTSKVNEKAEYANTSRLPHELAFAEHCDIDGTFDDRPVIAENSNIDYAPSIFLAEKVSFEYPITPEQYKAILEYPYGLVSINDGIIKGWIEEFEYNVFESRGRFVLIVKRE